jgi:hypothetical protein
MLNTDWRGRNAERGRRACHSSNPWAAPIRAARPLRPHSVAVSEPIIDRFSNTASRTIAIEIFLAISRICPDGDASAVRALQFPMQPIAGGAVCTESRKIDETGTRVGHELSSMEEAVAWGIGNEGKQAMEIEICNP